MKKERRIKNSKEERILVHLVELRSRLFSCLLVFILTVGLSYLLSDVLLGYLARPLTEIFSHQPGRRFIYTHLSEAFLTHLKTAFFGGCVLACPVWAYHMWQFVNPALRDQERRFYGPLFFMTPVLFLGGAALAYFVVCPVAWRFFLSFESTKFLQVPMQFEAKISEYISLTLKLMTVFGLSFQLPIVVCVCVAFGWVPLALLQKGRRYAFLLITIVAALITPPDFISPLGLIIPLYGLYELTLLGLGWLYNRKVKPQ